MLRLMVLCVAVLGLGACTTADAPGQEPPDLGDFRLGHNIVVAPNLVRGPVSREASKEEWITAVKAAADDRFGAYEGARLYHLGISVDGYVLALAGVPVIAAPKSVLIVQLTVWDDAAGRKMNDSPKRFTVLESLSGDTVIGSGLTRTRKEQMQALSRNAARQMQDWLFRQKREQGWFEAAPAPAPAPVPAPAAGQTQDASAALPPPKDDPE